MKIIKLTSHNVKKLTAVEITPKGDLVVIGGKNEAGKSSVLDSIMYALAGGDALPQKPVRKGASKAKVQLDLGDLIVTRTFTAAGGTALAVTNKEGAKYGSPQAMLDKLTGRLSFDPLQFSREDPKRQAETLRALAGLDFTAMDMEYNRLFAERALLNKRVLQAHAALAGMPTVYPNLPAEPVSLDGILDQIAHAAEQNQENADLRAQRKEVEEGLLRTNQEMDRISKQMEQLKANLQGLSLQRSQWESELAKLTAETEKLQDVNLDQLQAQLREASATNELVHLAQKRRDAEKVLKEAQDEAERKNRVMLENRDTKAALIQKAKFPIPGLGVDEEGVTMDGIPFSQCSSAQQLRVSVAIGLALNPKLKVLLIRDGSLLDDDNLALVAKMAAEASAQVWIERVEEGGQVSVVIEDGHVRGQNVPELEQNAAPVTQNAVPVQQKPIPVQSSEPPPEEDYEVPIP